MLVEPLVRLVVVVGDRLVGAVAARQHERPAEVGEQEVVERRVREHHAEPGAAGRDGCRDRRAVAPAQEHDRPCAAIRAAPARPARSPPGGPARVVMSANGLSSRCLRARSRATAVSSAASQARCQPPSPLTATIAPPRSSATASSSGSVSCGPQTGQQTGSAWKRRSAGSSYSRRQSAQSGKPAIVVFGRS